MSGVEVTFSHVTKMYLSGEGEPVTALADVSFQFAAGSTVAVTGPSGSGKSTLLHIAGAMDIADSGEVTVGGEQVSGLRGKALADYRRSVGFVFQRFHLLPALSVLDNVLAPVLPIRTPYDKESRGRELLDDVGLSGRENDLPSRLSGGQQQRVAIARALIAQPGLLLADEPTGNLDSANGWRSSTCSTECAPNAHSRPSSRPTTPSSPADAIVCCGSATDGSWTTPRSRPRTPPGPPRQLPGWTYADQPPVARWSRERGASRTSARVVVAACSASAVAASSASSNVCTSATA